ncbi:MAG: alpha-amylase, partial [Bacteroidales bacterium]|nr:alpha-amylase [Bacteroidales bacterium]
ASGNCFSPSPGVNDWYETIRLNYCDFHTPTWDRMLRIVRYWCGKGVDGFRCDMVEMVPWQFMKWLIERIKSEFPDVLFIAEVYQKESYRLYTEKVGFDFLYDKSGLYDSLKAIVQGGGTARSITWNWQFLGDLQPRMLNFIENHDEVRFASDYFGRDPLRAAALIGAGALLNDAPYMIYSGQEVGEKGMDEEGFSGTDGRTTIFDWWSVGSLRRLFGHIHGEPVLSSEEKATLSMYSEILGLADQHHGEKTFDLNYYNIGVEGYDAERNFAFLRGGSGRATLFVCDFSNERSTVPVRVPAEALAFMGYEKTETLFLSVPVKGFGWTKLPV